MPALVTRREHIHGMPLPEHPGRALSCFGRKQCGLEFAGSVWTWVSPKEQAITDAISYCEPVAKSRRRLLGEPIYSGALSVNLALSSYGERREPSTDASC